MIEFQLADTLTLDQRAALSDLAFLEQAARQALQAGGQAPGASFTVLLSDDEQLRQLNQQYLQTDAPTDVLSFPAGDVDPDTGEKYLGDIVISYPRAAAQAAAGGHNLLHELQLLVVHGTLHLLGYDHLDEAGKAQMWALQAGALSRLDNPLSPD